MNAFTIGQSLAPCVVGLLLGLGFIKWKWKLKVPSLVERSTVGQFHLLTFTAVHTTEITDN